MSGWKDWKGEGWDRDQWGTWGIKEGRGWHQWRDWEGKDGEERNYYSDPGRNSEEESLMVNYWKGKERDWRRNYCWRKEERDSWEDQRKLSAEGRGGRDWERGGGRKVPSDDQREREKDHIANWMRKEIKELREKLKSRKVDDKEISWEADPDKTDDGSKVGLEKSREGLDPWKERDWEDDPKDERGKTGEGSESWNLPEVASKEAMCFDIETNTRRDWEEERMMEARERDDGRPHYHDGSTHLHAAPSDWEEERMMEAHENERSRERVLILKPPKEEGSLRHEKYEVGKENFDWVETWLRKKESGGWLIEGGIGLWEKNFLFLSRFLSHSLRHDEEIRYDAKKKVGDLLLERGVRGFDQEFVEVLGASQEGLRRFSLTYDSDYNLLISANQGHGRRLDIGKFEAELDEIRADEALKMKRIFHGTDELGAKGIMSQGIKARHRLHIHLARWEDIDPKHSNIIGVDIVRAQRSGMRFFWSDSGAILSRGQAGRIPKGFLTDES